MGAERSFTAFPKLLHVAETIPDPAMRGEFLMGVLRYGNCGDEPDFGWPLDGLFAGVREDIDNSVSARYQNKGGRPRKGGASGAECGAHAMEETGETAPQDSGNGGSRVSENQETGVSEVSETGNGGSPVTPSFTNGETQTIPNQSIPNQTKASQRKGRGASREPPVRFEPPTVEEVEARAAEMGYRHVNPSAFVAFYASKGWMVGRNRMKDWKQALAGWECRSADEKRREGPDAKPGKPDWLDEYPD